MTWKAAALLALPFVAVAAWMRLGVAPHWGDAIAKSLGDVAWLVPSATPPPPPPVDSSDVVALLEELDAGSPIDAGAKRAPGKGARDGGAPRGHLAVHVPVWAVEKAIQDGGENVKGRTVRDADGKPAGVKLMGVSSAHVGLEDGDVIIAVDGRPTPTDDVATQVALDVIGRGDPTLRATVMRGDRPIDVTLDLPGAEPAKGPRDAGSAGQAGQNKGR